MHDKPNNPDPALDLALATLIRCAADDNLSMAQADALRDHLESHPEDQARIDFERALRDAAASAMDTGPAPAALRQSIQSFIAEHSPAQTVGPQSTRNQSFWRRSILPMAIAATVLLTFGVTMMITNQSQTSGWSTGLAASVVGWVEREHHKCCESAEYREDKLAITNVADAREKVLQDMGAAPTRIQLDDAGYTFAGYGACNIPGGGPSGQLIYTPNDGVGSPISLFVQRDDGQLNSVATPTDCLTSDQVFIWRADGLIYYLVTDSKNRNPDTLRTLGIPENQISL